MTEMLLIVPPSPTSQICVRDKGAMGYSKAGYIFPPYDLAMIAANLRETMSVKIIDANARRLTLDQIGQQIKQEKPKYVVFSNSTPTVDWDLNIARLAKQIDAGIKTITFGPHITVEGNAVMTQCDELDIAIRNEQELVLREIVDCGNANQVKGVLVREKDGTLVDNGLHPHLEDIDSLPFPAHDLLDLTLYSLPYARSSPITATMTSRGCPGRCIFCTSFSTSKRFLPRSPEHIMVELRFLTEDLNVHEVKFWDDSFSEDRQRVLDICQRIVDEALDLSWTCNARADKVDSEMLRAMKRAGCHTICLGVESGDDPVLKSIGKQVTTQQIRDAFKLVRAVNLESVGFFMLGHPDDTKESMQRTIDFAKELAPDYASFNIVVPFPGTPLFKIADNNGWLKTKDWSKYESTSYPVYEPPGASRDEIYKMFIRAYREYYFTPKYIIRRLAGLRSFSHLAKDARSAIELLRMLWSRG